MPLWEQAVKSGIHKFASEFIFSQTYIMYQDSQALIIDPIDTEEFKNFIFDIRIIKADVLLTHEHFDHIQGVNWLKNNVDTKIYASSCSAKAIELPNKNLSSYANVLLSFYNKDFENSYNVEPYSCSADCILNDRQIIQWNMHNIQVISTPGHSPGSVCFLLNNRFLFSGDTILTIPTVTRFPGGSKKDLLTISIPKLMKWKGHEIIVLPGHGDTDYLDFLLEHFKFY